MFDSADWLASRYGQMNDDLAVEVCQLLSENQSTSVAEFWDKADNVLKLTDPIIKVLRLVDGYEKPTIGFIYEAIDRMKESIKSNVPYYLDYWKRVDKRWLFLHSDLHAPGCYLNPQYMFGNHDIRKDKELVDGLKRVIKKLASDVEVEIKARQQVYL